MQALQTDPVKIVAKAVYSCGSCTERFTRLIYESLEARGQNTLPAGQAAQPSVAVSPTVPPANPYSYGQPVQRKANPEGLQFF